MDKKDFTPFAKKNLLKAVQEFEDENKEIKLSESRWVDLTFRGIHELDYQTVNSFSACMKLSLSSNVIQKLPDFHLKNLEILSLGRNKIK